MISCPNKICLLSPKSDFALSLYESVKGWRLLDTELGVELHSLSSVGSTGQSATLVARQVWREVNRCEYGSVTVEHWRVYMYRARQRAWCWVSKAGKGCRYFLQLCAGEREFFYMDNSVSLSVGIFLMTRQRPFHLTEYLFNSSPPIQVVPNSCPLEWQNHKLGMPWTYEKCRNPKFDQICPARSSLRIHVPELIHSSNFHSISVVVAIIHHQWN